jgi:serine/threonine-protein kinase RsbW
MKPKSSLKVTADVNNLTLIRGFVEETALALGADPTMLLDVVLAANEIATNIMLHGYQGRSGPIEIEVGQTGKALVICLRDQAPAFDPTTAPNPNLNLPLEERPLGKMGIYLTRQLVDEMTYRLSPQGGNELTLIKKNILSN